MFRLALIALPAALALPLAAQTTEGQQASMPPEVETGGEPNRTREMPEGNHTFRNDFPVASRIVANSELSDRQIAEEGTLSLSPPAIVMEGWEAVPFDAVAAADLEGIELYPQAWENLGAMGEVEGIARDGVILSLPRLAGLLEHDVLVPAEVLTILTPAGEPGSDYRAFIGTTEAILRDLDRYEG